MSLLELFKTFTRGQENAQDQLNANFAALEGAVIVDSGSNDSGNWTRFADGTMICTIIKKKNITIQRPAGGIFNSDSQKMLFPWPFASQPCVSHSVNGGYGGVWTSLGDTGVDLLGCSVQFWSGFVVPSTELTFSITAIGPWK